MSSATRRPTACENCTTPLQGEYCHRCGQSVHNPIRDARHAVEEFFEAFWHLDGRLWRTLLDLMVPGRTASNYLAGHRARYIPPLRLFVVLSVLTFFIGALTIGAGDDAASFSVGDRAIAEAGSVEEVQRIRDELLASLRQARTEPGQSALVGPLLATAETRIRAQAAERIAELGGPGAAAADGRDGTLPRGDGSVGPAGDGRSRRPQQDPVAIGWLPDVANAWLNRKMGYARANIERMSDSTEAWVQLFMGSVPSALFVLVPVFALLLKLAYAFTPRLYLEHMVVALYSHVFLLLALTAMFLLAALAGAVEPHLPWLAEGLGLLGTGIFLWMPLYLLLMQKQVYRQSWWTTVVKYLPIGFVYLVLLTLVTAATVALRLAQP